MIWFSALLLDANSFLPNESIIVMRRLLFSVVVLLGLLPVESQSADPFVLDQPRWWKGNLHTHSLWSDGDQFPEMIADWYRQRDYHFLALTDHNVLSEGMRWMSVKKIVDRSDDGIVDRYRARFGMHWVESRESPATGDQEIRLKPLDEFRHLLEERGRFLMIPAEEISDKSEGKPVHINATNLAEVIAPAGGETVLTYRVRVKY